MKYLSILTQWELPFSWEQGLFHSGLVCVMEWRAFVLRQSPPLGWVPSGQNRSLAGFSRLCNLGKGNCVYNVTPKPNPLEGLRGCSLSLHSERCPLSVISGCCKIDLADMHRSRAHTPDYSAMFTKPTFNHRETQDRKIARVHS